MENEDHRKFNLTRIPQLVNTFDNSTVGAIPQEIHVTVTALKKGWALDRCPYQLIIKTLGFQTVSFSCSGNALQIIPGKLVLPDGRSMGSGSQPVTKSRLSGLVLDRIAHIYLPSLNFSYVVCN